MKTALITTTINVPTVLELYRQHGPDVSFFVALDTKSVPPTILALDRNTHFLTTGDQAEWKCSELLGWNTLARRNIALLEAVKWGADVIVTIDDDNIPLGPESYFSQMRQSLGGTKFSNDALGTLSGLKVSSPTGWFDVGQLLDPIAPHRGFPHDVDATQYEVAHVTDARVGVAAGICLGDPDISAVTRIACRPIVHRTSELLNAGIVVDPATRTVFNTQNTAFIRELSPAMFMMPGVGRFDDIYASLITQRVMRERDLHVHFGRPLVWQSRNPHDLLKDLHAEITGMGFVKQLGDWLAEYTFETADTSVIAQTREIYRVLKQSWRGCPEQSCIAAKAYLDDVESLL